MITLESLVGQHDFGGLDFDRLPEDRWGERRNVVRFLLDGVTYEAVEDENDGYRSALGEIQIVDTPVQNRFGPVKVDARMNPEYCSYGASDILELVDIITGKPVLSIGTENSDDYYPAFVSDFQPGNMAVNQGAQ